MRQLSVFLSITAVALAQQAAPDARFRVDTELIQVNVIAQNADGKPVADLKREEFRIFDRGVAQEIRLFEAESEATVPRPTGAKASQVFTNQPPLSTGSRSGYAVILLDTLHTNFGDPRKPEEGSGAAIHKTLELLRSISPSDKIAIYALQRKLEVICEFTSDRILLEQRLRAWKIPIDMPVKTSEAMAEAFAPAKEMREAARIDALGRISASDGELLQVADHLAGIPGRKNLIWIADVFPVSGPALQKLREAGVAIYPVDAFGVCPQLVADSPGEFAPCPPRPVDAMNAIAAFTGGLAYYYRNDLDVAMREALDDGRVSYTLGYYRFAKDSAAGPPQVTVQVSRRGVVLRSQTIRQPGPLPVSRDPKVDAIRTMNQPVDATAIPIALRITPAGDSLDMYALLDLSSLDLVLDHGVWSGKLKLLTRFTDAEGRAVGEASDQTLTLSLRPATYEKAAQLGFPYDLKLKTPAKASELKLLFMNPATGKTGTVTVSLSDVKGHS
ncbi:MAG TPA: VWA domain-containing protein [Bryobacteraceae bacterium]|jgi:VWFA-related protein